MKNYYQLTLCVIISLFFANCTSSPAKEKNSSSTEPAKKEEKTVATLKANAIQGIYEIAGTDFVSGLEIEAINDTTFDFEIIVGNAKGCTGEIFGEANIQNGNFAIYTEEGCVELKFEFTETKIIITEKDCAEFHGIGCSFAGTYEKKKKEG